MKYAVWGTGIRGNLAAAFIGVENISVFIDENPRMHCETCFERKIVSFADYLDRYNDCYIIVSPNDYGGIVEQLETYKIKHYSLLNDIIY